MNQAIWESIEWVPEFYKYPFPSIAFVVFFALGVYYGGKALMVRAQHKNRYSNPHAYAGELTNALMRVSFKRGIFIMDDVMQSFANHAVAPLNDSQSLPIRNGIYFILMKWVMSGWLLAKHDRNVTCFELSEQGLAMVRQEAPKLPDLRHLADVKKVPLLPSKFIDQMRAEKSGLFREAYFDLIILLIHSRAFSESTAIGDGTISAFDPYMLRETIEDFRHFIHRINAIAGTGAPWISIQQTQLGSVTKKRLDDFYAFYLDNYPLFSESIEESGETDPKTKREHSHEAETESN